MFRTPQACLEAGEDYPQYDLTVGFDVGKRFHVVSVNAFLANSTNEPAPIAPSERRRFRQRKPAAFG